MKKWEIMPFLSEYGDREVSADHFSEGGGCGFGGTGGGA
jgi:hypothetical protein